MGEGLRQLLQPLRQRGMKMHGGVRGQRHESGMRSARMKPEILTVRRAYAVNVKTQDGACGEWFLRGER